MRIFRSAVFLLFIGIVAAAQSFAQPGEGELRALREFLNVPETTTIGTSTASLPNETPLKVYVATGQDNALQKVFLKGFAEWNKKNGAKFGSLEVVADISEAQIIVAWYAVRLPLKSQPPPIFPMDMALGPPERSHSYLLLRTADGLEILSRRIVDGYPDLMQSDRRGEIVRAELFKRMKARKKD